MAAEQDRVLEVLAGEYVLGTLDEAERKAAEALAAGDPAFAALVREWESRLAPLSEALASVEPPAAVKDRLMRRITGRASAAAAVLPASNVVDITRKLRFWQGATAAATALAAALAAFVLMPKAVEPPVGRYVAVLAPEGAGAQFLVSIDLGTGVVNVRRTGTAPEAGKSHELWAVGGGRDKPQSLGVIDASAKLPMDRIGKLDPETVFAISLEPAGGSPTGAPTGPVLFTGKLVRTE